MTRGNTTHIQSQFDSVAAAIELARQSGKPLNSEALTSLICSKLTPALVAKPGFQGAKNAQEVWELQKQMNDRLILIESKTAAILTQHCELLEYTIPRLFIVLPDTPTKWDPLNMIRTKFRLRFICECGEHTKATGSKIPHHLHLANHEGYLVNKPTEFFEKYGPFLILMLEMIKLGTSIAGHVVPTMASLKVVDVLDSAQSAIDSVTTKVIEGVDYSLKYLEENRDLIQKSDDVEVDGAGSRQQDLASYLVGVEGLEGVDLRQLGSYLTANSSDNLLGNLYRMTTESGHVKWVCRDHYRAGYQEALTQKLRDVVKLNIGTFDEQMARIEITLKSSFAAAEFYAAIHKAKGVLDLDVSLQWNQGQADFSKLRDMISTSNIRSIKVDLHHETGPNLDISFSGIRRYDPIFDILRLPSIQSFQVGSVPKDFFRRSSPLTKKADFSNLRHLGFVKFSHGHILEDSDIVKLKQLITRAPKLSSLSLEIAKHSFERVWTWPRDSGYSSLGRLEIGLVISDTDIVKCKLQLPQGSNPQSLSMEAPRDFFERTSSWPRSADFRNLRHLEIGRLDSVADIVNFELVVAQTSNLSSLTLENSKNFFERSSPWPRTVEFSNLRHLEVGQLDSDTDILNFKTLVSKAPNLSTLSLKATTERLPAMWNAIAEYQTYPIVIRNLSLHFLPPRVELRPRATTPLDPTLLFNIGGTPLEPWDFQNIGLSSLSLTDLGQIATDSVASKVLEGFGHSLAYLEETRTPIETWDDVVADGDAIMLRDDVDSYLAGVNGLEQVDKHQLASYLATDVSESLLDKLYCMTTMDGHAYTQKLRDLAKQAGGKYDEELGRIETTLKSSSAAAEFYDAVRKVNSVLELVVGFSWLCTESDLEVLENVLKKSGPSTLQLNLGQFRTGFHGKPSSTSARSKVLSTIMANSTLTTLNLKPKSMGDDEVRVLAEALKTNSTLSTLKLEVNSIGFKGAQALSEALKANSTLRDLYLWDNSIGSNGAQSLSEALRTNSGLTYLNLDRNSLGDSGARAISEALKTNSTLTTLRLESNSIGDNGAQALSEALKANSSLAFLNLYDNSIGDIGARALSETLKTNTTLTSLYLKTNSIGDIGAQTLSEALNTNTTLTSLYLNFNKIGAIGAQALFEARKTNSILTTLEI
ncbi:hypothetical protein BGZ70_000587 [Mortierella alpina]|uniref:RNI-like protein n=1 Tax=Mortierella alpina TaxID=64518 RepID=A0A9P6IXJ9_MORAP|nr:hypothetical protein BGZ70_000587 [Mortierella alpina]